MSDGSEKGFVDRLSRQGEEALGRVAEQLVSNPIVSRAVTGAFDAREKAVSAQEATMGALNLPSAADVERLTRRLRTVSQRLESIEESLDRIEDRVREAGASTSGDKIEKRLDELTRELSALRDVVSPAGDPVPRAQERLVVTEPS